MTHIATKHRTGWSLVEMLCVMTVLGIVAGVITTFLSTTSQFNKKMRSQQELQKTASRLAEQFRQDVRLCSKATVGADELTLKSVAVTITYKSTTDGVIRETGDPKADPNGVIARDGFWLPNDWQAVWQRDDTLVSLIVKTADDSPPQKPIVIQANLAGDLRQEGSP